MKKVIFFVLLFAGIISFFIGLINESIITFLLTSGTGVIAWFLYLLETSKKINNKIKYKLIHWKLWIKNPTVDCDFKAEYLTDNEVDLNNIVPIFNNASKVITESNSQVYFIVDNKKYNFNYGCKKVILTVQNFPVSYRTLNNYLIKKLNGINENLIKKLLVYDTSFYFTLYHNENYTHSYIYDFKESLTNDKLVYYNFEYEIEPKGRVSIDRKRTEIYTAEYASLVDLINLQI